jgi:hypothetical protein
MFCVDETANIIYVRSAAALGPSDEIKVSIVPNGSTANTGRLWYLEKPKNLGIRNIIFKAASTDFTPGAAFFS